MTALGRGLVPEGVLTNTTNSGEFAMALTGVSGKFLGALVEQNCCLSIWMIISEGGGVLRERSEYGYYGVKHRAQCEFFGPH